MARSRRWPRRPAPTRDSADWRPLLGQAEGEDETGVDTAGDSVWSLADAVPPESVAAVALIEHIWAGPLNAAIQKAGGAPLEETWLAPDDLAVLEALMNQRDPRRS